jgi:hypothetical protein
MLRSSTSMNTVSSTGWSASIADSDALRVVTGAPPTSPKQHRIPGAPSTLGVIIAGADFRPATRTAWQELLPVLGYESAHSVHGFFQQG